MRTSSWASTGSMTEIWRAACATSTGGTSTCSRASRESTSWTWQPTARPSETLMMPSPESPLAGPAWTPTMQVTYQHTGRSWIGTVAGIDPILFWLVHRFACNALIGSFVRQYALLLVLLQDTHEDDIFDATMKDASKCLEYRLTCFGVCN